MFRFFDLRTFIKLNALFKYNLSKLSYAVCRMSNVDCLMQLFIIGLRINPPDILLKTRILSDLKTLLESNCGGVHFDKIAVVLHTTGFAVSL